MAQLITLTLAPGQSNLQTGGGKFLNVKQCDRPLTIAYDGGPNDTISAGQSYNKSNTDNGNGFRFFTLTNNNAVSVTVSFSTGSAAVIYSPADNSASNAQTYAFGNIGIANGAAINSIGTGSPACDANGFLTVLNSANYKVSGTNNGHRRQLITFTMAPATSYAYALNILDANGFSVMTMLPGQIIALPTDSDLYISGAGGTAGVTIGQMFLAS